MNESKENKYVRGTRTMILEPLGEFAQGVREGKPAIGAMNMFLKRDEAMAEIYVESYLKGMNNFRAEDAQINMDIERNQAELEGLKIWQKELQLKARESDTEKDRSFYYEQSLKNGLRTHELQLRQDRLIKKKADVHKEIEGFIEAAQDGWKDVASSTMPEADKRKFRQDLERDRLFTQNEMANQQQRDQREQERVLPEETFTTEPMNREQPQTIQEKMLQNKKEAAELMQQKAEEMRQLRMEEQQAEAEAKAKQQEEQPPAREPSNADKILPPKPNGFAATRPEDSQQGGLDRNRDAFPELKNAAKIRVPVFIPEIPHKRKTLKEIFGR